MKHILQEDSPDRKGKNDILDMENELNLDRSAPGSVTVEVLDTSLPTMRTGEEITNKELKSGNFSRPYQNYLAQENHLLC